MFVKFNNFFLSLSVFMLLLTLPKKGAAMASADIVTRQEVLNVAREIHPPGCTDSRTADYCQLSTAYEVRGEIQGLLEQGMNKEQVINHLVDKYGERILAAPLAEGFNLLPWFLPGIGLLVGVILVGWFIYRWVKKSSDESERASALSSVTEEEELKVKQELKNWL